MSSFEYLENIITDGKIDPVVSNKMKKTRIDDKLNA